MTKSLNIIAVGDLSFNGNYRRALAERGPLFPFQRVAPLWKDADLRFGNLESPITDSRRIAPAKFTLRGTPLAIDALVAAGFDAVSLANNHMMDFGADGLLETCRRLDAAGIAHVGAGQTLEKAAAPIVLTRNGFRIGLLAYCDVEQISSLYATDDAPGVAPFCFERCVEAVNRLRPQVDWIVVHLHWGEEMSQLPSPKQRGVAAQLAAAGADLVLGHHPHVLQPLELAGNALVAYSLGDFLFSNAFWHGTGGSGNRFLGHYDVHPLSRRTGWLHVELSKEAAPQAQLFPARLERNLQIVPSADDHFEILQRRFRKLVSEHRLDDELENERHSARARERWRLSGRRWLTRVKIKLLQHGFFRGTYIEPDNVHWNPL